MDTNETRRDTAIKLTLFDFETTSRVRSRIEGIGALLAQNPNIGSLEVRDDGVNFLLRAEGLNRLVSYLRANAQPITRPMIEEDDCEACKL